MAADVRDPQYGKPYVGTPVQQAARSGQRTVLDMFRNTLRTVTVSQGDSHYTPDGHLYHE